MNLTERIYDGFLSGCQAEIRDGSCTKEEFVRSCDVALGALKLSSWSDVDPAIAFRLVIRYWDYTESNPTAGTPLMMDDIINAMTLTLLDEGPERLLGMPEKEFFLLPFEGGEGSLLCFQSAATPGLAFVAMNPFSLKPDYAPVLSGRELEALEVERSEDLCFYTLCVVRSPVSDSTVNLRCPVAVNDQTRRAMQVILEGGGYQMHHPLSEFGRTEEGAPC